MKQLPYVIAVEALTDIDEIWLYTVNKWSVEQANRYYNLIIDEISRICEYPDAGNQWIRYAWGIGLQRLSRTLSFTG